VEAAAESDVRFVFETHLHNDYVSGGISLARAVDAELVLPASSGAAYRHRPAFHLEDIDLGAFVVRPLHTPGHTPEHTSYLIVLDGEPVMVFSGGSLLVGSAGRPDLLGMDRADTLARLQYISVNRLAALGDDVELYPTHGEGSFCSVASTSASSSTIGVERRTNPVLGYSDADTFVKDSLDVLQPFPDYYAHMGPINLMGPEPTPALAVPEIAVEDAPSDGHVIDIRPRGEFAAGHLVGAIGIEHGDQTAVWAGWLVPFNAPIVLVANRDQDVDEIALQFARIGFDNMAGVIFDLTGAELSSHSQVSEREVETALAGGDPIQLIDVRAPGDWDAGHLEGSVHRYVPHLRDGLPPGIDPDSEVWLICHSGNRASISAGLVEALGATPVVVASGGVESLLERLEAGPAA